MHLHERLIRLLERPDPLTKTSMNVSNSKPSSPRRLLANDLLEIRTDQ